MDFDKGLPNAKPLSDRWIHCALKDGNCLQIPANSICISFRHLRLECVIRRLTFQTCPGREETVGCRPLDDPRSEARPRNDVAISDGGLGHNPSPPSHRSLH